MAREQWAKAHASIADSLDFADLFQRSPTAAVLFTMSWGQAAPWGVLPGDPRLFSRRVCGLLGLSAGEVETCLRLIIEQGMYTAYTGSDGRPVLYITHWNRNNGAGRQWERCGLPEFELPPSWEPPAGLAEALKRAAVAKRSLTIDGIVGRVVSDESKTRVRLALQRCEKREGEGEGEDTPPPLPPAVDAAPPDTRPNSGEGLGTALADLDGTDQEPPVQPAEGRGPVNDSGRPHDAAAILGNRGVLMDAVRHATSDNAWSLAQRKALVLALHQAIEDDATPVTEADVIGWLGSADTRPILTDRTLPDKYLRRMMGKREHARIEAEKAGQATRRAPPPQALDTLPSDARRSVHDILEAEKRRIAEEDRQARMRRTAQGPVAEVTAGDAS